MNILRSFVSEIQPYEIVKFLCDWFEIIEKRKEITIVPIFPDVFDIILGAEHIQ